MKHSEEIPITEKGLKRVVYPADVRHFVKGIKKIAQHDPEVAHAREEQLYIHILKIVANNPDNLSGHSRAMALEAVKLSRAKHPRWYA